MNTTKTDKLIAGGVAALMTALLIGAWVTGVSVGKTDRSTGLSSENGSVNVQGPSVGPQSGMSREPALANPTAVNAEIQESARENGISEDVKISVGRVTVAR